MVRRAARVLPLCAALALCACKPRPIWSVPVALPETRRALVAGEVVGGEGRYGSHAWLGLPFAAPPVASLRWKPPRPAAPWEGQRAALRFPAPCAQVASPLGNAEGVAPGELLGSEDCLYLNVWAPRVSLDALASGGVRLPVMVWIHGGGNSMGATNFYEGGRLAASENVVVVSVQYRLGPFGWLRHQSLRAGAEDEGERSGNFGTLDLVAALEWVKANVAAFGGDPDNVTVFGESAGGLNVYSLLVSPRARGLFHRAIAQSGGLSRTTLGEAEGFTDQSPPGHLSSSNEALLRVLLGQGQAKDRAQARAALGRMGDAEVAALWRGLSTEAVLAAYKPHMRAGMLEMPLVFPDGAVLPKDGWLEALARQGGWNRVPVVLGTNRDEVKLFFALDPKRVRRVLGVVPRYLDEPSYHADAEAMSRLWKATGADGPAAAMRASGAEDVFVYRFDWRGEPTRAGVDLGKLIGAAHALEIPFVFGHFDLGRMSDLLFDPKDAPSRELLSSAMRGYWSEFARTGKPGKGARGEGPEWTAWTSAPEADKQLVLDLPQEGGVRMNKDAETMAGIVGAVLADARLPARADKCRLLRELASWSHGASAGELAAAGAQGCLETPPAPAPREAR